MNKKREGQEKRVVMILFCVLISIFLLSSVSASLIDWIRETLTGKATTATLNLNITVGVPQIIHVWNYSSTNFITEYPGSSSLIINFTIYNPSGFGNLNDSTARINLTRTGEDTRQNNSCIRTESWGTDYANYSCNITMFWYDGNGTWNIGAYIEDNNSNGVSNISEIQKVGPNPALTSSPAILTWSGLASGSKNQTSNNDPVTMNNTGNVVMGNITINSTDLRGETNPELGLWADNFTVSYANGGTPPAECSGTAMSDTVEETFTKVATANLTKGNFTINNGNTGQEQLYFCLREIGAELTTQAYSTKNESAWVVKGTV